MGEGAPKRACDRCHAVKEKCRWTKSRDECERCHRLQSLCQSLRPIVKVGRKSRYLRVTSAAVGKDVVPYNKNSPGACSSGPSDTESINSRTVVSGTLQLPRAISVFIDLNERELQLLHGVTLDRTRFDHFLIAPSFHTCHLQAFTKHLFSATPLIRDAFIASAALIACEFELHTVDRDRMIGHKRAASAVSALRSLKILSSGDVSAVLLLAINAVTFALHISGSAFVICRHSLHLVKPFYDSTSAQLDPDNLAFFACLISSETAECLFRSEIPTIRLKKLPGGIVDRYLGIALPLLSYMYDICEISHALHHDKHADLAACASSLDTIEQAVDVWRPSLPGDFHSRFSRSEIVSMLAQAKITRWSIQLIIHRLLCPYGTEISKGTALSDVILEELDRTIRLTKRSIPCVKVPLLVASFELTDPIQRQTVLDKFDVIVEFSEQVRLHMKRVASAFWSTRDSENQFYWYDLPGFLPLQNT